jgi:hypothetical protein
MRRDPLGLFGGEVIELNQESRSGTRADHQAVPRVGGLLQPAAH